jgi:hypothetical protein
LLRKKAKELEKVEAMVNYSAPYRSPKMPQHPVRHAAAAFLWVSLTGALCDAFRPHCVPQVGEFPGYRRLQVYQHPPYFLHCLLLLHCSYSCVISVSNPEPCDDGRR